MNSRPFHAGDVLICNMRGYKDRAIARGVACGMVFIEWESEDVLNLRVDYQRKGAFTHLDGAPLGEWEPLPANFRPDLLDDAARAAVNSFIRGEKL